MNLPTAFLFLATGAALALALRRLPPLHPIVLWTAAWSIATGLYALHLLPYAETTWKLAAVATGGTAAFCLGAWLGDGVVSARVATPATGGSVVPGAALLCAGLTTFLLLALLVQVSARFGVSAALISSAEVRRAIGDGFASVTIKFVYPGLATAALAALAAARSTRRTGWLVLAGAATGSMYFSTGRSTILLAAITAASAYLLGRPRMPSARRLLPLAAGAAVAVVVLMLVMGQLLGKTFANSEIATLDTPFDGSKAVSVLALPYHYASTPIAALQAQVDVLPLFGRTYGCALARDACAVLDKAGMNVEPEPRIRPFTGSPLPWNTYTALDLPLVDFGVALFWLPILLTGLASGAIWRRAIAGSAGAKAIYAVLASAIMYSTVQYNFLAPHVLGAIAFVLVGLGLLEYLGQRDVLRRVVVPPVA
jgi:oligosaccharide repeat unit polymerase